jgi:hypothetical protein
MNKKLLVRTVQEKSCLLYYCWSLKKDAFDLDKKTYIKMNYY